MVRLTKRPKERAPRRGGLWMGGALGALAVAATSHSVRAQTPCSAASIRAPGDVTISSVTKVQIPTPYCRVDGYVTTRDPGPNKVRFMVALPDAFNGRYLFTAQGGAAGFVPDPTDSDLKAGFAIASTDKGAAVSHNLDFTFWSVPAQAIDWGHRGVHVAAQASQAITRDYYRRPKMHRYIVGCSGGGLSVVTEAERYPGDFDGYVGGAMSVYDNQNLFWGKIAQRLLRDPSSWISPGDLARVEDAIMAKYDDADGALDRQIWDPRVIRIDRDLLSFLTEAQYGTVALITGGLKAPGADHPGYWAAGPKAWSTFLLGSAPPPWDDPRAAPPTFQLFDSSARALLGADYDFVKQMDFNDRKDIEIYQKRFSEVVIGPAPYDAARLAAARRAGARILLWSGAADQSVSPENILKYQADADRIYGPVAQTFMRTFLAPGMYHCRGGVGPVDVPAKALEATIRWVETGQAPDSLITSNPTSEFLLCPVPRRAVPPKRRDPAEIDLNKAKNWSCEA